jgi:uncharacterized membrane protein YgdD (TMEM256/DUF423 family)
MITLLIVLAGLMGAGGIVLAAAAAHMGLAPGSGLEGAANLLMIHAAVVLAAAALMRQGLLWGPLGTAAMAGFALGAALFAGDIARRAFAGHPLFPFAAPSGGSLLILSWLVLAAAAIAAFRRGNGSPSSGKRDLSWRPWPASGSPPQ